MQSLYTRATSEVILVRAKATLIHRRVDANRAKWRRELVVRSDFKDVQDYAYMILVKDALRDREDEAMSIIMAELQQMVDKKIWHGVHSTSSPLRSARRGSDRPFF